jgi:hypothetical protein
VECGEGIDSKRQQLLDQEGRVSRVDCRGVTGGGDERTVCGQQRGDHEQKDRAQHRRKKSDAGS